MDPKTLGIMAGGILLPGIFTMAWLSSADARLQAGPDEEAEVAIASAAEDEYCTPGLKKILRRVAGACGLLEGGGRGCQPGDAKSVAAISGSDFNALFKPLSHRVSIVQFDHDNTELDMSAKQAVEDSWSDQRGASFFFVVSRASPDGDAIYNQQLSQKRAESVLGHLETKFQDPDLKKEVGLMSLGEEFAQLGEEFCGWKRSREGDCSRTEINRSAFVAWIDCAI
jgi:outer membrane protein OmpA-like peptidoglycan-associated protein